MGTLKDSAAHGASADSSTAQHSTAQHSAWSSSMMQVQTAAQHSIPHHNAVPIGSDQGLLVVTRVSWLLHGVTRGACRGGLISTLCSRVQACRGGGRLRSPCSPFPLFCICLWLYRDSLCGLGQWCLLHLVVQTCYKYMLSCLPKLGEGCKHRVPFLACTLQSE
jgi:hypothetical protein